MIQYVECTLFDCNSGAEGLEHGIGGQLTGSYQGGIFC